MDQKELPEGSQERVLRTLRKCGVTVLPTKSGKGSHRIVTYGADGRSTVQAGHITRGMLKTILNQLGLDWLEFRKAW